MQLLKIIVKSIFHYKWQYLALFAGILLSTAVITGALITGDSVKLSLKKLVGIRLGNTGFAMETGDRFFTDRLAANFAERTGLKTAAVLKKSGSASNPANGSRVGKVMVLGVDNDFFDLNNVALKPPATGEAIVSENLAVQLGLQPGDDLIIRMESSGIIPPDLPFAPENYLPVSVRLKITAIAGNEKFGRFSLQSNQVAPFNVFVNRQSLAGRIEIPGRANLVLIENTDSYDVEQLNNQLSQIWNLQDAGIKIETFSGDGFFEMTSDRIFIDPVVSDLLLAERTSPTPILTYLINSIEHKDLSTPYSFVTATAAPVLSQQLARDEIIINTWLADDLKAATGDTLTLKYFVQGERKKLTEKSARFVVAAIVPLEKSTALQSLMPEIPGLADAGSCSDWEAGVPVDLEAIREKDEKYWDDYRGTPKAFVAYETGKQLWANEFGRVTGIRFFAEMETIEETERFLTTEIDPSQLQFRILDVKGEGMRAAASGVDFGELFISLSFFVILAGLLLTALLFQLQIVARSKENAVFTALGFSRKFIIRLRILEALPVVIFGAMGGALAGILYTKILMVGMNTVWEDIVQNTMLWLFVKPQTIAVGTLAGIIAAFAVIYFVTTANLRRQVNAPFRHNHFDNTIKKGFFTTNNLIAGLSLLPAALLLGLALLKTAFQHTNFTLIAGGLLLVGMLALFSNWLIAIGNRNHTAPLSILKLAMKNAGRNKNRSLSTIALLALGAFTIIVTGANRQTFYGTETQRSSGTGGFLYWVETAVPLFYDLNTEDGRRKYALDEEAALADAAFFQMNNLSGDDASCLNLNQVSQPQILGVDAGLLNERGSFSFAKLSKEVDHEMPWLALNLQPEDDVIPAFADQTVITWGLMKKVGDTLQYLNEAGKEIKLVLAGGLNNSVFQGNILIADNQFRKNFPSSGGSQVMLIDAPANNQEEVYTLLNSRLADLGANITPATLRLANFNAVTNTYLSVFMILGGLGMIIGTIGLAIVLLRNIRERKSEIALLSAIGFKRNHILKLIILENLLLLIAGILTGTIAAMAAILPTFITAAYTMSLKTILALLAIILFNGTIWIFFTAKFNISQKLVEALRDE